MKNKLINVLTYIVVIAIFLLLCGCGEGSIESIEKKRAEVLAKHVKEVQLVGSGQHLIALKTYEIEDVFAAIKKDGGKVVAISDRRGGIVHLVYEVTK